MIEDFFDHECDIYFPTQNTDTVDYGLPGRKTFQYPATPSLTNLDCHFAVKTQTQAIQQDNPQNRLRHAGKLTLPAGTEIPPICKIINKSVTPNEEFTGKLPLNIRNHHVTVELYKRSEQEPM